MIDDLAWINFEKGGPNCQSLYYIMEGILTISEIQATKQFSRKHRQFSQWALHPMFRQLYKKQNYVCERKIVEKRGQKKGYFCPYK